MKRALSLIISCLGFVACSSEPEPLRIAVMMPVPSQAPVPFALPNVEWAKDNANAAGGITGRPLAIDYFPITDAELEDTAQRLAADEKYLAVIGPGTSEHLMKVADTFVRYRKPLVSFGSSSAEPLRAYGKKGVIWRTRQSDIAQTEVMIRHAKINKANKIALISSIDTNGITFFEWFGFLAREYGYAQDAIHIETLDGDMNCEAQVAETMAFSPDILFIAASNHGQQQCLLKAIGRTTTKLKIADTGLYTIWMRGDPSRPPPPVEGFGGSVSQAFSVGYQARFGRAPAPIAAAEYDTVLLLAYGLAASQGRGGNELIDALKSVVSGQEAEEYGWTADEMAKGIAAIAAGRRPRLRGASAPLVFESMLQMDLKSALFSHWVMRPEGPVPDTTYSTDDMTFLTSQGILVNPGLSAQSATTDASAYSPALAKSETWAVIAVLSSGYSNYRHQADALAQYQLLRKNGVPDDHIILIMDDGIARAAQNPRPGVLVNTPGGENVYHNLSIDYDLKISGQDIVDIITGKSSPLLPAVLSTQKSSNLYVYLVGHGGKQGISIGGTTAADGIRGTRALTPAMLKEALCTLRTEDRLRRALVVVESCYAGVFGDARYGGLEGLCGSPPTAPLLGVALLTAANNNEVSYAADYDSTLKTWVSDAFSRRFLDLVSASPATDLISLYGQIYLGVSGSHASFFNASSAGPLRAVQIREFLTP